MGMINILPDSLINKIAAGEVIERPASIVKELVENAIDAQATTITVEIEEGGKRLVRVVDDGDGMAREDIALSIKPHATSKLRDAEGLFAIGTMGFRGEALASIASVSETRIVSTLRGAGEGWELRVRAGEEEGPAPAPPVTGTSVEIRDLFHNVPVRRKFLRRNDIEEGHVEEMMTRFAVAFPAIRFTYLRDGRTIFNLAPCENVVERIAHFHGKDLADALIVAEKESPILAFRGYLAPPKFSRVSLRNQMIFLNGRFIRDRVLTRAINESYREMIPHGRFATIFLFLDAAPGEADVNVHPTKIEVRFRNVWRLHDQILETFRAKLIASTITPGLTESQLGVAGRYPSSSPGQTGRTIVDFFTRTPAGVTEIPPHPAVAGNGSVPSGSDHLLIDRNRKFFQVHDLYLIEEAEDGIVIIDQHALHERAMYEQLKHLYETADAPRQRLLIPTVVELTPQERAAIEDARSTLETMGIEFDDFGKGSVAIRTMPALLKDLDPVPLVKDFVDLWMEKGQSGTTPAGTSLVEEALHMMACRSAVKAGDRLMPEEVERLLARRNMLEYAQTCVHGRPTSIRITLAELEKFFDRRK